MPHGAPAAHRPSRRKQALGVSRKQALGVIPQGCLLSIPKGCVVLSRPRVCRPVPCCSCAGLLRVVHTAGYQGKIWPNLSGFLLPCSLETHFVPTVLLWVYGFFTSGCSKNPCVVRCVVNTVVGVGGRQEMCGWWSTTRRSTTLTVSCGRGCDCRMRHVM